MVAIGGWTSGRSELFGVDAIALHLEVQGLVVHSEESGGLALVAARSLKRQADRQLLDKLTRSAAHFIVGRQVACLG